MPGTGPLRRSSTPVRKKAIVDKSRIAAGCLRSPRAVFLALVKMSFTMSGITEEAFMQRIGVSLDNLASAILTALGGGVPTEVDVIAVTQAGIEPLT
jgi:hypothetical protein